MTPPWPDTGPNGTKKVKPPLDRYSLRLLTRQDGPRPPCGDHLLTAESATAIPRAVGTMVATRHPQGDSCELPRPPRETQPSRR